MAFRELITVVVLVTNQRCRSCGRAPAAALNVGASPVEIREAVYQCAPFLGSPKTLNGVSVMNEVFAERGVELPLPDQATVAEHDAPRGRRGSNTRCTATKSARTWPGCPRIYAA